ncbi:MAG: cupin domain-containing protein [Planctomycetota bacterium]|jgi:mannose-6-phosphate isomerase-like protein (cupin superfamily)
MDITNAIAKVRFNSARPQRVQLAKCTGYICDLLCLEPGQELTATGECAYYIVAGNGNAKIKDETKDVEMGNFIHCPDGESHTLVNSSEQRLICLSVS